MGFATPFPEPESPVLLPFVVSARPQLVTVLQALCNDATQLNVFFDGWPEFAVVRLQEIDEAAGRIYCDLPSAPLDWFSRQATFVGFTGPDKVQFTAQASVAVACRERPALGVPFPASLLLVKRRKAERTDSGPGGLGWLRLPSGSRTDRPLLLCDLSPHGLAVEVDSATNLPAVGSQIDRCRLDLPGVGGTEIALTVRHCTAVLETGAIRFGCEFVNPTATLWEMVGRYLRRRETSGDTERGDPFRRHSDSGNGRAA
jgi:hypothetical protein